MPILFYAPWAVFCTLAGYLADRYSKRNSLVFWKFAEVGITLVALVGFFLGGGPPAGSMVRSVDRPFHGLPDGSAQHLLRAGKYGAMPEILQANCCRAATASWNRCRSWPSF